MHILVIIDSLKSSYTYNIYLFVFDLDTKNTCYENQLFQGILDSINNNPIP